MPQAPCVPRNVDRVATADCFTILEFFDVEHVCVAIANTVCHSAYVHACDVTAAKRRRLRRTHTTSGLSDCRSVR